MRIETVFTLLNFLVFVFRYTCYSFFFFFGISRIIVKLIGVTCGIIIWVLTRNVILFPSDLLVMLESDSYHITNNLRSLMNHENLLCLLST